MNEIKDIESSNGLRDFVEWMRYSRRFAPGMMEDLIRTTKIPRISRFESTGHTNCKYCRKKCKLFKQNECWRKTYEEQIKCENYKGAK